jgi:hypothetical protein
VIDLLAITDDLTLPSAPVGAVRSGELCVLYAPAPAPEQEVTAESLWRREEMLEALMGERDLLPVRYGTLVADEHAAAEAVAERGAELAAGLDRVRGAVELALRVRSREAAAPAAAPAASGREYLRAKAAGAETATRLHEPLAALARESVTRGGSDLLRAAYLVDRDAVEPFVALVRRLQDAHPDLALLCTGPWPPYSFAGEAGTP